MARQEEIDVFMREYGMDIDPAYRALDVSAELGEVAAEMLAITEYGERQIHTNENLEKEFGDLYFSLIALANKLNIDLDAALDQAMEKYKQRIHQHDTPSSSETRERQRQAEQNTSQQPATESGGESGEPESDVVEATGRQPQQRTGQSREETSQTDPDSDTPWDVPETGGDE